MSLQARRGVLGTTGATDLFIPAHKQPLPVSAGWSGVSDCDALGPCGASGLWLAWWAGRARGLSAVGSPSWTPQHELATSEGRAWNDWCYRPVHSCTQAALPNEG